ncbi:MAG TPA: SGNH/GDSL hydrolase family protein [Mycobacteriales bacterium]|nr:SGNH/GDSL hydrolase family protein [Mycobacteriales bacterium]
MSAARRTALRTGVGVLATGLVGAGVLAAEAELARRREYVSADSAPHVSGTFGAGSGTPLRLAVLGDSTAAGLGVRDAQDTVGARLARELSAALGRPVEVDGLGVSGARSADLDPQVSRALLHRPDVAVVLIGPNDATHLTSLGAVEDGVRGAVRRLRAAGVEVVVGSCADMGSATAFHQPLRLVAAWRGRAVGSAARSTAVAEGAAVVDIGAETGPAFRAEPDRYLSEDEFHPSAEGYGLWAEALLPAVRDAALSRTAP